MPRKKSESFTDDNIGKGRGPPDKQFRRYKSYDAYTAPPVPSLDVPPADEEGVDPVYSMLRRLGGHSRKSAAATPPDDSGTRPLHVDEEHAQGHTHAQGHVEYSEQQQQQHGSSSVSGFYEFFPILCLQEFGESSVRESVRDTG